jgi:hypothetical protein
VLATELAVPFLLQQRHVVLLHADQLGGNIACTGVADPEVAKCAGLAADVKREDDRRVLELKLRVVVADLRGLEAESFLLLLEDFGNALEDPHRGDYTGETSNLDQS